MLTIDQASELCECLEQVGAHTLSDAHHVIGQSYLFFSVYCGYWGEKCSYSGCDPVARDVGRWLRERFDQ